MISQKLRDKIKADIGKNVKYSPTIVARLKDKQIKNSKGEPYRNQDVVNVFNGEREIVDIEMEILDWYDEMLEKKKKLAERKAKYSQEPAA